VLGELDAGYSMFSVTLNEAIALRQGGELGKARQEAGFCAQLIGRLVDPLATTLEALESHARYYGTLPNAAPLNPAFFRFPRSQKAAWMQSVMCRVLFSARSQFFHKLRVLRELVEALAADFQAGAMELEAGTATNPGELWDALDLLHYDLNTCLRETLVVLKSFFRVLPEEELGAFQKALEVRTVPSETVPRWEPRLAPRLVPVGMARR
jgi:hypothetical protein